MNSPQIHFIIGLGRSGTTLLMNILNANEEITALPEIRFFNFFYTGWKNKKTFTKNDIEDIRTYLLSYGQKAKNSPYIWKENELYENLHADKALTFKAIYSCFYSSIALKNSTKQSRIIFDKNPINTIFISEIMQVFPEARFIFMVRDPRANYLSRKQKIINTPEIFFNAYRWNRYNQYALNLQKKIPEKFILLRYEDLVTNTEAEIRRMAAVFGFSYDPDMLNFHRSIKASKEIEALVENDTTGLLKEKFEKLSRPVNTTRLESWRTELSEKEIGIIDSICGKTARQLGYDLPVVPKTNIFKRIKGNLKCNIDYYFTKLMFQVPLAIKLWRIRKIVSAG